MPKPTQMTMPTAELAAIVANLEHRARWWREQAPTDLAAPPAAGKLASELEDAVLALRTLGNLQLTDTRWERRRKYRAGPERRWVWTLWESCSHAEALTVSGSRLWETRPMLGAPQDTAGQAARRGATQPAPRTGFGAAVAKIYRSALNALGIHVSAAKG